MADFNEAIFCDTGAEYPETYEYLNKFIGKYPVTVVKSKLGSLYDYCWKYRIVPRIWPRWCTVHFKIKPKKSILTKPSFLLLAFSTDESKRAKISIENGIENRFPLLEHGISRQKCKEIILDAGLPIPHRSKCWFCPFQTIKEWKELRMNHPDLFCKAEQLEARNMEYLKSKGKNPLFIHPNKKPLRVVVNEKQGRLWEEDRYPPCECML